MGGILLPKLNIGWRPIANKYREGKVKRTLERGLKACKIVEREANGASFQATDYRCLSQNPGDCPGIAKKMGRCICCVKVLTMQET